MTTLSIDMLPMRARRSDPQTSHRAAANAAAFASSHAGRIHLAIIELKDATAEEIAFHTGLTVVQICRRTGGLKDLGLIRLVLNEDGTEASRGGFQRWEPVA